MSKNSEFYKLKRSATFFKKGPSYPDQLATPGMAYVAGTNVTHIQRNSSGAKILVKLLDKELFSWKFVEDLIAMSPLEILATCAEGLSNEI